MGCLDGCKDNAEPDVARVIRSIQKWRPICYTHQNYNTKISLTAEPSRNNVLQFPRKQVIEWVEELKKSRGGSNAKTASYLGLSPSYVSKLLTSCR